MDESALDYIMSDPYLRARLMQQQAPPTLGPQPQGPEFSGSGVADNSPSLPPDNSGPQMDPSQMIPPPGPMMGPPPGPPPQQQDHGGFLSHVGHMLQRNWRPMLQSGIAAAATPNIAGGSAVDIFRGMQAGEQDQQRRADIAFQRARLMQQQAIQNANMQRQIQHEHSYEDRTAGINERNADTAAHQTATDAARERHNQENEIERAIKEEGARRVLDSEYNTMSPEEQGHVMTRTVNGQPTRLHIPTQQERAEAGTTVVNFDPAIEQAAQAAGVPLQSGMRIPTKTYGQYMLGLQKLLTDKGIPVETKTATDANGNVTAIQFNRRIYRDESKNTAPTVVGTFAGAGKPQRTPASDNRYQDEKDIQARADQILQGVGGDMQQAKDTAAASGDSALMNYFLTIENKKLQGDVRKTQANKGNAFRDMINGAGNPAARPAPPPTTTVPVNPGGNPAKRAGAKQQLVPPDIAQQLPVGVAKRVRTPAGTVIKVMKQRDGSVTQVQ